MNQSPALRIDFHLLPGDSDTQALQNYTERLICKIHRLGHPLYLRAADHQQAMQWDERLWQLSAEAFVPHALATAEPDWRHRILIGHPPVPLPAGPGGETVLLNLSSPVPENFASFARVLEVAASADLPPKEENPHYSFYRQQGYDPICHRISRPGR